MAPSNKKAITRIAQIIMRQQDEESEIPSVEINNDTLDDDGDNDTEQNARTRRPPNKRMQSFPTARRQFRGLADAVMVGNDAEFTLIQDEQSQLDAILHETAKSAYAIGCIEVYVFKNPRLIPIGFWIDSSVLENASLTENDMELLLDPQVAYPNNDLVGLLWSKEVLPVERVGNDVTLTRKRFSSLVKRRGSQESVDPTVNMSSITTDPQQNLGLPQNVGTAAAAAMKRRRNKGSQQTALHWTELPSVIQDPDQSHGMRTELLYKAGLVKATGIPFNVARLEGMVVYYGTAGANSNLTTAQEHETYLQRVTHVKGAALASVQARRESLALLQSKSHVPGNETNEKMPTDETMIGPQSSSLARRRRCRECVAAWFRKIKGSGAQIPPGISWSETAWTFVGSFIGMLTMYAMNEGFEMVTEEEYFLIGGPFGALAMLQYGLIGAPASQPRSM